MWHSINSTKKYLEGFAKHHSFDSLVAENWYSNFNTLVSEKVKNEDKQRRKRGK